MKKDANFHATAHLHIRISPADKEYIRKMVAKNGLHSISEFILLAIKKIPVENRKYKQEFIQAIRLLTQELNHIGHNINQAVTAIHIMNLKHEFQPNELQRFNTLLDAYLQKREELKPLFKKMLEQ